MPVGFPTKVNYATGDVLSATNMNDLSGTVNLLESAQYAGSKNPVLNSNFSVWQRGTSVAVTASSTPYTADRWQIITGASQAYTVARTATNDTTNLPFIQYCSRVQRNSGQTGTGTIGFAQSFESINSIPLAGKSVTFSFYARAGANYSATSNGLVVYVATGTGTNQNLIVGGFTGSTLAISQTATLTTTWQRFTYTATLASTATQVGVEFLSTPTGTAGANDYFEVTGVQLEASTVASAYTPNGATAQAELAACQRYYVRFNDSVNTSARLSSSALNYSSTEGLAFFALPVPLRVSATSLEYSTIRYIDANLTIFATPTLTNNGSVGNIANLTITTTGMTTGRSGWLTQNASASAYVAFNAEL